MTTAVVLCEGNSSGHGVISCMPVMLALACGRCRAQNGNQSWAGVCCSEPSCCGVMVRLSTQLPRCCC